LTRKGSEEEEREERVYQIFLFMNEMKTIAVVE
jgi:hypothetical protein